MRQLSLALFLLAASAASGQISVISTTPADNTTSVPLTTTVSVTFSGEVDTTQLFAPGETYFSNITSLLGQWWSTDRRTIFFSVTLQPSTVYFLIIHSVRPVAGGGFPVPYCFYWTTGASFPTNLHTVSGTVVSGGSPVTPDNAIVGLGETPFSGGPPNFIGAAVTNALGQFSISYVPDGTWYPVAAKDANLDGVIEPGAGDPLAFGDSVTVTGGDVSGVVLPFLTFAPLHFNEARETILAMAATILPPNRQLRQFHCWGIDSTGATREFNALYTVPGSPVTTEIWAENTGVQYDTTSTGNPWIYQLRPYTGLASAALLDSVVARAEQMGGQEFRRQPPPAPGSNFQAYARLGALHNSEFGMMISDTSQDYWGLQYMFQIQVTPDSTTSVARMTFLASATTGEILGVTGADEQKGPLLPTSYALAENYPNPFNPSTTVTFTVPTQSRVLVEVYNLLGQKVATLVNDIRTAGSHQTVWMAQAPSGIYFCRMEAVGTDAPPQRFIQVRKMMLVR
jgi:hypothetical protein